MGAEFEAAALKAVSYTHLDIKESDMDLYGNKRADVIKSYGITVADAPKAKMEPKDVHCFMELHVEQGASLYKSCLLYTSRRWWTRDIS